MSAFHNPLGQATRALVACDADVLIIKQVRTIRHVMCGSG
jgi:hypothetical protein